jgi:hypothetical protein
MKSILDRNFKYTPSFETNLKNTFARIRKEMKQAQATAEENKKKVLPIRDRSKP